ncbi:MAG: peptidylprolyl isomerase [Bdellovibrionota bacterium]|nr:peptidylprolyl isomerase [Bdellovibrionota bacterium]
MIIEKDCVVSIEYTLTDAEGKVLDKSDASGPLKYLHGHQNIIPGLEDELAGKTNGDELDVSIEAAKAYGQVDSTLIQEVPKEQFASMPDIKEGMQVQAQTDQGPIVFMVTEVKDDTVVVDANHPLAGIDLNFSVKVVEVRKAEAEEIAHGHVH